MSWDLFPEDSQVLCSFDRGFRVRIPFPLFRVFTAVSLPHGSCSLNSRRRAWHCRACPDFMNTAQMLIQQSSLSLSKEGWSSPSDTRVLPLLQGGAPNSREVTFANELKAVAKVAATLYHAHQAHLDSGVSTRFLRSNSFFCATKPTKRDDPIIEI